MHSRSLMLFCGALWVPRRASAAAGRRPTPTRPRAPAACSSARQPAGAQRCARPRPARNPGTSVGVRGLQLGRQNELFGRCQRITLGVKPFSPLDRVCFLLLISCSCGGRTRSPGARPAGAARDGRATPPRRCGSRTPRNRVSVEPSLSPVFGLGVLG